MFPQNEEQSPADCLGIYFIHNSIVIVFAINSKDSLPVNKQIQTLSDIQKKIDANKKIVADFYQELFGDKEINAIDKYIGETYIQHNPSVADGKEALRQAVAQWFKGAPKEKIGIQHLNAY